jgi:hypothetical protein
MQKIKAPLSWNLLGQLLRRGFGFLPVYSQRGLYFKRKVRKGKEY